MRKHAKKKNLVSPIDSCSNPNMTNCNDMKISTWGTSITLATAVNVRRSACIEKQTRIASRPCTCHAKHGIIRPFPLLQKLRHICLGHASDLGGSGAPGKDAVRPIDKLPQLARRDDCCVVVAMCYQVQNLQPREDFFYRKQRSFQEPLSASLTHSLSTSTQFAVWGREPNVTHWALWLESKGALQNEANASLIIAIRKHAVP